MTRLRSLTAALGTIDLDAPCPLDAIVADARELLASDSVGIYSVHEGQAGWRFDRYHVHADGTQRIRAGMLELFARGDVPVLFYDIARPAPDQRNKLIEATAMIDARHPGGWRESALCREVLEPLGLATQKQHRILLCDGASLLAWFGTFHGGPLSGSQQRTMHAIARPLARRLRAERRLAGAPRTLAALEASLEQVGAPAFVVTATGTILTLNTEGRRLLASSRDVRSSLHDAVRGRPTPLALDLTEIRGNGVPSSWIAVVRPSAEVMRMTALARATTRWGLTRRQAQVLDLVVRGLANQTIAAELKLTARAVEMHVSALLARLDVDSRAAMVSAVLTRAT